MPYKGRGGRTYTSRESARRSGGTGEYVSSPARDPTPVTTRRGRGGGGGGSVTRTRWKCTDTKTYTCSDEQYPWCYLGNLECIGLPQNTTYTCSYYYVPSCSGDDLVCKRTRYFCSTIKPSWGNCIKIGNCSGGGGGGGGGRLLMK